MNGDGSREGTDTLEILMVVIAGKGTKFSTFAPWMSFGTVYDGGKMRLAITASI